MSRDEVLAELKRLKSGELASTLGELRPAEREQVLALLRDRPPAPQSPAPFEALVSLSPWLLKAAARVKDGAAGEGPAVTPAARAALAEALEAIGRDPSPAAPAARPRASRPRAPMWRRRAPDQPR
jgi:hypothetical protein